MSNNRELVELIKKAKQGDMKSTFEIILKFENEINKYSQISGEFNQECKDYIIDDLIKNIRKFKKI